MDKATEEMALPIAGKKREIKKEHLFEYYGKERLKLSKKSILSELQNLIDKKNKMEELINISFLSLEMKEKFSNLFSERHNRLTQ